MDQPNMLLSPASDLLRQYARPVLPTPISIQSATPCAAILPSRTAPPSPQPTAAPCRLALSASPCQLPRHPSSFKLVGTSFSPISYRSKPTLSPTRLALCCPSIFRVTRPVSSRSGRVLGAPPRWRRAGRQQRVTISTPAAAGDGPAYDTSWAPLGPRSHDSHAAWAEGHLGRRGPARASLRSGPASLDHSAGTYLALVAPGHAPPVLTPRQAAAAVMATPMLRLGEDDRLGVAAEHRLQRRVAG